MSSVAPGAFSQSSEPLPRFATDAKQLLMLERSRANETLSCTSALALLSAAETFDAEYLSWAKAKGLVRLDRPQPFFDQTRRQIDTGSCDGAARKLIEHIDLYLVQLEQVAHMLRK